MYEAPKGIICGWEEVNATTLQKEITRIVSVKGNEEEEDSTKVATAAPAGGERIPPRFTNCSGR